jgi:delta 1-pyrroline-5-carboxylate dehydrogenase
MLLDDQFAALQIEAVDGCDLAMQPFGGEGLSGTGPKAGGPHDLYRFCAKQTLTINTAAAGGNAELLAGQ